MTPDENPASSRPALCPICGKPATQPHRPFCSARCRSIDLGRWLRGVYSIETDEGPDDRADDPN